MSIEFVAGRQNQDGGWPYVRGASWTEPTVYAVLALLAAGKGGAAARGIQWLRTNQRADGGWPPRPGIEESTWVTALVALAPRERLGAAAHAGAIAWLIGTEGRESTFLYSLRQWLMGNPQPAERQSPGWPWLPGTAAWVAPTSLAVLALLKEEGRKSSPDVRARIEAGRRFLIARACAEGGWNHGSTRDLGYDSGAYPETTGMALAALRGVRHAQVEKGLAVARGFMDRCRSADAQNWLTLGLQAHGETPAAPATQAAFRTVPEAALSVLASARRGLADS